MYVVGKYLIVTTLIVFPSLITTDDEGGKSNGIFDRNVSRKKVVQFVDIEALLWTVVVGI